ncbi:MAG TPA: phosphoglucosamine mutase, partial [Nitrospirae bacterium]|nr:phosphoglucosamine mutase [Nitrospirota bacterium]
TVMSNLGIEHYLERKGIKLIRTNVGDRFVVEEIQRGGYNLGGEQSGHIIFFDYNTTGDGPVTALQMLYLMKKTGAPLSEMVSDIFLYPQILENVKVKKKDVIKNASVTRKIKEAEKILDGKGRVLVRPSGTEQKVRVMVEGSDRETIQAVAAGIVKTILSASSKD